MNNITSENVEPGMVLALGAGTLNYRYAEVENVVRMPRNAWGYVVAHVTFTSEDEEPITIYGGQVYQRDMRNDTRYDFAAWANMALDRGDLPTHEYWGRRYHTAA